METQTISQMKSHQGFEPIHDPLQRKSVPNLINALGRKKSYSNKLKKKKDGAISFKLNTFNTSSMFFDDTCVMADEDDDFKISFNPSDIYSPTGHPN
jgi:hypothetical protein